MRSMKSTLRKMSVNFKRERGGTLMEVLLAVALLGILGATFIPALFTSSKTAAKTDQMVIMNDLARAQMEYTKNYHYISGTPDVLNYPLANVYDATDNPNPVAVPTGYSISVLGHALNQPDNGIQEITVTIHRGTESLVLKDYKANR